MTSRVCFAGLSLQTGGSPGLVSPLILGFTKQSRYHHLANNCENDVPYSYSSSLWPVCLTEDMVIHRKLVLDFLEAVYSSFFFGLSSQRSKILRPSTSKPWLHFSAQMHFKKTLQPRKFKTCSDLCPVYLWLE